MLRKKRITYIIILFILLGFSAHSNCKTFSDSLGREVKLDREPSRILPLAPNITEILYFIGLGDRVVGVTNYSYYPPEAFKKPKIGSYNNLNVEKIISLSPDIVIGTKDGNMPGTIDLLDQAGIQSFIVNPRKVADVIDTIEIIGNVCGVQEKAGELSKDLRERLKIITGNVRDRKKPVVFLQININPIMTVNRNTFHHDLITLAGGINMTGDEPMTYPRISIEELINRKPDIIIISSMERGGRFEKARLEWLQWKSIPAVQNNRVYLIDSDLIDRPSPRIIEGLEKMAEIIHPEVEWDKRKAQGFGLKVQGVNQILNDR